MTDIKQAAIEKLAGMGAHVPAKATMEKVADIIGLATGVKRPYYTRIGDFVQAFVEPPKAQPPQFNLMTRKAMVWNHPRDAEIGGLPRPIVMSGVGNGGDNGMGRGR